jgi:enoyl-CoA hydratase
LCVSPQLVSSIKDPVVTPFRTAEFEMTKQLPALDLETLRVTNIDHAVTVVLNRPKARNAMSMQMCRDMIAVFGTLRFDTDVRVVVIRGEGPAFCAGIDLTEFKGRSREWVLERRNLGLDAFQAVENCPIPVIAELHGAVVGAGCEIAAACDFDIAAKGTIFRWPEVVWGAVGATQRLPRLVGMPMAKDLLFTGRTIDADEALRLGLITRIVNAEELSSAISKVKQQFVDGFPLAARLVKKSMMLGRDVPIHVGIDLERQLLERSLLDSEWTQGIAAFEARMKK